MELKILSPKEEGFPQEIRWNNEELKAEIAEKMQEYKTLAFTEETIKEAKADRAKLNKLRTAFEDERKRIKKLCMAPYDSFEVQVKELLSLIDEPIRLIDGQIKEVEQRKRDDKRREVERIFKEAGFQPFVTLEQVWDEKWLNATVPISRIEEQMKSRMYQIGNDVLTIRELPEFSFEAMEVYKKTLDLAQAIKEGQRLSDIQKRKAAYEAEQRRKQEEAAAKIAAARQACPVEQTTSAQASPEVKQETVDVSMTQQYVLDFRVWGTKEQIMGLKKYLVDNNIRFGKVG